MMTAETTPTPRICARCDRELASKNTNPEGLCGMCQGELDFCKNGRKYQAWKAAGKPREIHRTPSGRTKPLALVKPPTPPVASFGIECRELGTYHVEDLLKHIRQLENRLMEAKGEANLRVADLERIVADLKQV